MGYLVLGFILGLAAASVWQFRFNKVQPFQQLMQRELVRQGQNDNNMTHLKNRLEMMEQKLAGMESELHPAKGEQLSLKPLPITDPEVASTSLAVPVKLQEVRQERTDRRVIRRRVLELWQSGVPVNQIIAETGLARGEVELMINLGGSIKAARQ